MNRVQKLCMPVIFQNNCCTQFIKIIEGKGRAANKTRYLKNVGNAVAALWAYELLTQRRGKDGFRVMEPGHELRRGTLSDRTETEEQHSAILYIYCFVESGLTLYLIIIITQDGARWAQFFFNASNLKSEIHYLKVSGYVYSINIFNNNLTKIKLNKKVYTRLEMKMKNQCAWLISPHAWGRMSHLMKGPIIYYF